MNKFKGVKENTGPVLKNPNLHIIFLITLMAVMGVSSITPAFPMIIRELQITPREIGLLITAFTIPGIFLTPFMGVLADRYGRKTMLIPMLIIFGLFGFLCTFTKNFEILIILRILQGIGGSALGSINITLIGDIFSGNQRAAAMGYNSSVLSIGTAAYPAIGGVIALAGWNYPFVLPVLSLPVALLVLFRLKNPEPGRPKSMKEYLLNTWRNINKPMVWGLFTINILIFVVLYGSILTYFPIYLEHKFGSSSLVIGLVMTVMSLSTAITASRVGYLVKIFKPKFLLIISFCIYSLAFVLYPLAPGWGLIIVAAVMSGMAHGVTMPNIQNLLVSMAPLQERAAFMSLNSMVLRIGQTIGPVFMGLVFIWFDLRSTFYAAAVIALLMIIITIAFVERS
jgi:ACDE family multidrug resistance protein